LPKLYYASPRDLPFIEPHPGVKGRVVHGQNATMIVYDYAPKTVIETHKHDAEKVGVVVKGSLAMVIAGEQRILNSGDSFRVPAATAHGARVFEEPAQIIEVFSPPRTDLPKAPGWPGPKPE
jgi:quercetin dioxygenase-like cupin family protein